MTRRITPIGIEALRPRAKRYEKPAGDNLYVEVHPTGRKSFKVRYRFRGRSRNMTLQGGVSLAAARKEAAAAAYMVEQGIDPSTARQQARQEQQAAAGDTLASVFTEYVGRKRREGRLRSLERLTHVFERKILPVLGTRPIGTILRSEIIRLLDKVEDESGPAAADEVLSFLSRVMNWHTPRSIRSAARWRAA